MPSNAIDIRGVYVHVPFCDGKCPYCAFYSERYNTRLADRFIKALTREMLAWQGSRPATIYIGGGTPTLLDTRQWQGLITALHTNFNIRPGIEWSVEANPGSLTPNLLEQLTADGVNRISLGAQSMHDRELQTLGRRHTRTDTLRAVKAIKAVGLKNFNLDIIAGIPGTTRDRWRANLHQTLELAPAHISIYALTVEEGAALAEMVRQRQWQPPDETRQLDALAIAEEILHRAGYIRYEISNYAKPGFACRHNLDCWRGRQYAGFGPGAASHTGRQRRQNTADLAIWLKALESRQTPPGDIEELSPSMKRIERVIFGLRMAEGIPAGLPSQRQQEALHAMKRAGLIRRHGSRLFLTRRGRELADYVAVELIP